MSDGGSGPRVVHALAYAGQKAAVELGLSVQSVVRWLEIPVSENTAGTIQKRVEVFLKKFTHPLALTQPLVEATKAALPIYNLAERLQLPLILLCGPDGTGKTSIAQALAQALRVQGWQVEVVGWGDALKEFVEAEIGIPNPKRGLQSPEQRAALAVADHLARKWWRRFWIDRMVPTIRRHLEAGKFVIVDDGCYVNEVAAIREMGGLVFLLQREGYRFTVAQRRYATPTRRHVHFALEVKGKGWEEALEHGGFLAKIVRGRYEKPGV